MKVESNAAKVVMPKLGEVSGSAMQASAATSQGPQIGKGGTSSTAAVKSPSANIGKFNGGAHAAKSHGAPSFNVTESGAGDDLADGLAKQIGELDRQIQEKTDALKAKGENYDAADLTDLQKDMQRRVELQAMLTKILQMEHEMRMSIINAFPSGR